MASVEAALSKVAAYAADDSHGYELGWHSASAMGGGTDCSGLVRYYAALLAGVATDDFPDFSTRTERSVLTGRGWSATAFSLAKARRGDVLLSEPKGHTVVYLGDSRILGAEGDWDGRRGDSGGREVCERDYYDYSYNWILRPPSAVSGEGSYEGMSVGDFWTYNWGKDANNKTDAARGNVYDRLARCSDAAGEIDACKRDLAGDGRKNSLSVRIAYIDRRVREMCEALNLSDKHSSKRRDVYSMLEAIAADVADVKERVTRLESGE